MKLFEINYKNIPGPGDYHPGDEYLPGSPDYNPSAGRRRSGGGYRPSQEELNAEFDADRKREDEMLRKKERDHASKITDVEETQDHVHGKQYAPIITRTGIAADKATADKEVGRLQYVAYRTYDTGVEPLPDGRFKFMIKYMM
jgi:hypothetical protein